LAKKKENCGSTWAFTKLLKKPNILKVQFLLISQHLIYKISHNFSNSTNHFPHQRDYAIIQYQKFHSSFNDYNFISFPANWLKICSRDNPNENDCFKEMFQGIFPYIAKGIPEMQIEPFEPLKLPQIVVERNTGEMIQLNGSFQDLYVRGPRNSTVRRAK
jgi:hypothetical protein